MSWIDKGSRILVIHYEDLTNSSALKPTLKDVCKFLDFEFNEDRFNCLIRHPFSLFQRNKGCMKNVARNGDVEDLSLSIRKQKNIFQTKHNIRINSAIEKINNAARRRGLLGISHDYKNTKVQFNVCKHSDQAIK